METMIQARKGDSEFMQEYNNIPNPRDYIELGKANQRVFEILYYLR